MDTDIGTNPSQGGADLLGRLGTMEVRLAANTHEVEAAQRLRHDVFYGEMAATADAATMASGRDADPFDDVCDHLIVVETEGPEGAHQVVATYRLLRQEVAERQLGFYSASEFDIGSLVARHPGKRFLELGRSCVREAYRNKRTIELLWQGTWAYILRHRMDVLFGCASLAGTDQAALRGPLSFLHHHCTASAGWPTAHWGTAALPHMAAPFEPLPVDDVDPRKAMRLLPPLVKGYLRLGAKVSDGAVIDRQFGTTDVAIILPVDRINPSYVNYYGAEASRHAARP